MADNLPEIKRWSDYGDGLRLVGNAGVWLPDNTEVVTYADHMAAIVEQGDISYMAGKEAARDAVAALPDARYEHWVRRDEALAAIDALRGES